MRNDWPEEDSGIKTAFAFAMPARVEEILAGKVNFFPEPRFSVVHPKAAYKENKMKWYSHL